MILKTYNKNNFFKHTFCEFIKIDDFSFPKDTNYKSKSESYYFYTDKGVYRKSGHWGRVGNCRWKLLTDRDYKNQNTLTAFAKWSDFYPINSINKIFFITVNFNLKTAIIQCDKNMSNKKLFTFSDASKRLKQISHLFKEDKWAMYFEQEIDELRFNIISEYINSDKTLREIKNNIVN